ncbi:MAG: flippase-like domain-containing protein [Bacteroidales bacterium]|nr:flippase-like domain-containing protein [Bacteroidales bacterium]
MKKWFNILLYISFFFFAYYLYKEDFFDLQIFNPNIPLFAISVLLLWLGFFLSGLSWSKALNYHSIKANIRNSVVSHGLAIFAKYIPGKIWVILGRASYISTVTKSSLKICSFASLKEQLIYVWLGLIISLIPMLLIYETSWFLLMVVLIILFLSFVLFSKWFHRNVITMAKRISKREIEIPIISFNDVLGIVTYVFIYWIVWMAAFYFLVVSINESAGFEVAFAFPVAVSLGVLAIFFPGGIGVREGIMVGFLSLSGIELKEATTISIISRFWFISGEIFIFFFALIIKRR